MATDKIVKLIIDDTDYQTTLTKKYLQRKKYSAPDPDLISAYIPGTIIELYVKAGDRVKKGDLMFILEAMKMKNNVHAHRDGTLEAVYIQRGVQVAKNQQLLRFKKSD